MVATLRLAWAEEISTPSAREAEGSAPSARRQHFALRAVALPAAAAALRRHPRQLPLARRSEEEARARCSEEAKGRHGGGCGCKRGYAVASEEDSGKGAPSARRRVRASLRRQTYQIHVGLNSAWRRREPGALARGRSTPPTPLPP